MDFQQTVYRNGAPRVTESLNQHTDRRSTGYYGSGVYAYQTLSRAAKDEREVYALDISHLRLYHPVAIDELVSASSDMLEAFRKLKQYNDPSLVELVRAGEVRDPEYLKWVNSAYENLLSIPNLTVTRSDVQNAIADSLHCRNTVAPEDRFHRDEYCSVPLNYLLRAKGYDGVQPDLASADSNTFGVVIFREALDHGIPIKNTDDIPGLGKRINLTTPKARMILRDEREDPVIQNKDVESYFKYSIESKLWEEPYHLWYQETKEEHDRAFANRTQPPEFSAADRHRYLHEIIENPLRFTEIMTEAKAKCDAKYGADRCDQVADYVTGWQWHS
jgi:hypothetical protein